MKNGKVDFNNTVLVKDDIGTLKITNSNLYFTDDRLILTSEIKIQLEDLKKFYSLLQTPKNNRKIIDNIIINFNYDFLENKTNFRSFIINNKDNNNNNAELNAEVKNILRYFNNQEKKNFIKTKIFINKLIEAYSG